MEQYLQEYARWQKQELPEDLAAELALARKDEGELQDRFCRVMRFGTSGLRGKMGVGTNRINSIILSKATRAISRYLTERYESPAMVIGYDTRHNSREYADGIAQEFARSGIRCYLFAEPTPVRTLGCTAGIVVTASHNPPEYNGYKVYDHFGNQIDDRKAALIEQYMEAEPTFCEGVPKDLTEAQKEGTISFLEEDIKEAYLAALERETLWWNEDIVHCKKALGGLRICYTPLNGSGRDYVLAALERVGVREILRVESQDAPNGDFPTCPSPNPEYPETFAEALRTAGSAAEREDRENHGNGVLPQETKTASAGSAKDAKMAGPAFSDRSGQ